ncbi:transcription initiation factor TFIID component TAF4 family-domain-containing protein [Glomus cerebriforme]|uniref:Transcription initiation factor TFIID subunit 4 n=1 Tax=Glomus cerebriforme TaxID=658196 RepID=A0A397SZG9_9GLOM|nr:transcription initiation factor TFIID component TAF4 family-domain-containing protein [Glomus cerebriforme]
MKKSPVTTTPIVKLEQQVGVATTNISSSTVSGGIMPIPLLDPTMSAFPRIGQPMGQPMGPPSQPPVGYRSINYNNNPSNPIMVLPRINTQTGNPLLSRRSTAPVVPGTTGAADEKASYDDVLTFTGVDLKEETDNILRENELLGARQSTFTTQLPDRSRTQSFLDQRNLTNVVASIAMQHKLGVSPDVMTYLALATQERVRALVESMIAAKNHRIHSEHIHHPSVTGGGGESLPMYKETISLDVKSQLLAIEKVEREQERKRKEIRAGLKHDNKTEDDDSKDQQADVTPTTAPKRHKRQKRDTLPTPAIHKLTVDTKNTNMTALSAAGGKTKSWMIDIQPEVPSTSVMNGGDVGTRPSRGRSRSTSNAKNFATVKKGETQQAGGSTTNITTNPFGTGQQQPFNGPVPTITVKDALFVLERDRGGGGGTGSGREVLMKVLNRIQ